MALDFSFLDEVAPVPAPKIEEVAEERPTSKYGDCFITEPDSETIAITVRGVSFNMKLVEGGMLDKYTELSDFYIGETVVTQELWQMVMGDNPSEDNSDLQLPVTNINSTDCTAFMLKLKALTGKEFDLPTVYQWKFAYKGGNKSRNYKFAGGNNLNKVAWTEDNSEEKLHPVGMLYPNELGLCDMEGNVHELVQGKYSRGNSYRFNPECEEDESYVSSSALCEYGEDDEEGSFTGMRLSINIPVSQVDIDEKYRRAEEEKHKAEEDTKRRDEAKRKDAEEKQAKAREEARQKAEEEKRAKVRVEAERKAKEEAEQRIKEEKLRQVAIDLETFQSGEKDKRLLMSCYKGNVFTGFKSQYKSSLKEYTIPSGFVEIERRVFEDYRELRKVVIPFGVTKIGNDAFAGCYRLEEIELPETVTCIENCAFKGCSSLKKIKIPHGVTTIPFNCFDGCRRLESAELPDTITKIESEAFIRCNGLKAIKLPQNLKEIGSEAFYVSGLTSLVVPNSVSKIGMDFITNDVELHLEIKDPRECKFDICALDGFFRWDKIYIPKGSLNLYEQHHTFRLGEYNLIEE